MERTEERLMVETESISSLLYVQNVFEIVEELVIICLALLLYRQVTVVLRKYIRSISRDEAITPGGTSELRYLAAVINQYVALQSQRQKELRTIAELDALTQIPNRRAGGFHETHVSARGHARRADAPRRGRFQADQRQLWP